MIVISIERRVAGTGGGEWKADGRRRMPTSAGRFLVLRMCVSQETPNEPKVKSAGVAKCLARECRASRHRL